MNCRWGTQVARELRAADEDESKTLSVAEFRACVRESLRLSQADLTQLVTAFRDGDGVSYEDFLKAARGPVSRRRQDLVRAAFAALEDGRHLAVEDLVDRYDASRHPDVVKGARTAHAVAGDFLDTFEVTGEIHGRVSLGEFQEYYANVSSCCDSDDHFERVLRDVWRRATLDSPAHSLDQSVQDTLSDRSKALVSQDDDFQSLNAQDDRELLRRQDTAQDRG